MRTERPPGKNSFAAGIIGRLCPLLLMAALSSCNALVKVPRGASSLAETPPARLTGLERLRFTVENLGEVEPGLLYRSANPGRNLLDFLVKRVGLKYVINLRSSTDPANAAFIESIGGRIFSLPMSASRPPRPAQVLEFIRITQLARQEGASILVHCMAGADRTGMMVGAWRRLFQGVRDRGVLTRETRMYRHLPLAWPNVHRYIKSFRPELFQQFIDDPALLDDEVLSSELEKNFLQDHPLTGGKRKVTSGPLRAGTASMDLVGDWSGPLQLATYGPSPPRALGVRQPVEARALVLDNGSTRLALVSCDLLIMHRQLREAVLKKLATRGTSLDGILLSATHTHTSVGAYIDDPLFEFYMLGPYDPKWADHLAGRISQAITRAAGALQEARLGCGRTFISGASYNRRRGPVTDPELVLVKITDAAGKPLALLANFAGHPILEPDDAMLSPDYPGILSRKIDARYGFGFFLQGALGDLNAGSKKQRHEWKKEGLAEKVAEEIYQAIGEVYDRIPVKAEVKLASLTTSFRLPEVNFNLVPDLLFPLEWAFSALAGWPRDYPLQGIRVGDAAILATASELSCGLGLQVKRNSPAPFTLVASHCGDYAGYALPQLDHAHTKLDASSIVALGGPAHGPHLVASSAALLDALWEGEEKTPEGPRLSPAARHGIVPRLLSLDQPAR
ncbi:MAG: neutral/alkaline non-lysosomal ceramidase N-terminal domain-containing protein, partial [Planctomycetota bacterium]|nr:neutral/alkaline non-lysosomal ceramidase N-terminal domain-containing protein [Planctomycetota bacterium]